MLGRDNASLSKILRYQFSSDKEMYNELYKLMGGNKIPATNDVSIENLIRKRIDIQKHGSFIPVYENDYKK